MQGYQLTFFTEQNRMYKHQPLGEWLLQFAKQHGAAGGSLVSVEQGFDQAGHFHSAHFFELADQPLAITLSVDADRCQQLLADLAAEDINLAYTKVPIEYGHIGLQAKSASPQ